MCVDCGEGFTEDGDGGCDAVECPDNCAECDDDGSCTECQEGFVFDDEVIVGCVVSCEVDNCMTC